MQVNWILSGPDIKNNQVIFSEIDFHGDRYTVIKPFAEFPIVDGPVIAMAPLDMCCRILKSKVYPGAYCSLDNLKCSVYYQHFRKYLLNQRCLFLPIGLIRDRKDDLFNWLGCDNTLFIRPDSGFKNFTGHAIEYDTFISDIDSIRLNAQDDNLLCLVSSPRNILKEWRFVIGKRKIISSSQYRTYTLSPSGIPISVFDTAPGSPENVQKYVQDVLLDVDWEPDKIFTIDVCETLDNNLHILELNCFSAAGLYQCNISDVISMVRDIVIEDWADIYS